MTSKIAIVTGGSRGIGRNIVENLAQRGVDTIFTYHTHAADAGTVVAEVKNAKAIALQLDTGDPASFDAFCQQRERRPRQTRRRAFRLSGQ